MDELHFMCSHHTGQNYVEIKKWRKLLSEAIGRQVYSFYLSPFTEDGVLSQNVESFHEIRNPFTEFGVLQQAEDERILLF